MAKVSIVEWSWILFFVDRNPFFGPTRNFEIALKTAIFQIFGYARTGTSVNESPFELWKKESQIWGKILWEKKTELQHFLDFFESWKKQSLRNVGTLFFHNVCHPYLGLCFFQSWHFLTPLSHSSSYVLDPGFRLRLPGMLWHYYLHQMKLFKDFDPKKSNLVDMLIMQYAVTIKLQKNYFFNC